MFYSPEDYADFDYTTHLSAPFRATTILALRHKGHTVIAGDGQVSRGNRVVKAHAKKIRRVANGTILAGFAGSAADGISLLERFEAKVNEYGSNLSKAAVELAKDWRSDKILKKLQAMLIVASSEHILMISGNGDVIQPDQPLIAIGSGGLYAQSAAIALVEHSDLDAEMIARSSMNIAADLCVYTNNNLIVERL